MHAAVSMGVVLHGIPWQGGNGLEPPSLSRPPPPMTAGGLHKIALHTPLINPLQDLKTHPHPHAQSLLHFTVMAPAVERSARSGMGEVPSTRTSWASWPEYPEASGWTSVARCEGRSYFEVWYLKIYVVNPRSVFCFPAQTNNPNRL